MASSRRAAVKSAEILAAGSRRYIRSNSRIPSRIRQSKLPSTILRQRLVITARNRGAARSVLSMHVPLAAPSLFVPESFNRQHNGPTYSARPSQFHVSNRSADFTPSIHSFSGRTPNRQSRCLIKVLSRRDQIAVFSAGPLAQFAANMQLSVKDHARPQPSSKDWSSGPCIGQFWRA